MFGLGMGELLVIFLFALLFIGPKKLPELAKGLGKGLREFQKAKDDIFDQVNHPGPDKSDEQPVQSFPKEQESKDEDIEAVEEAIVSSENDAPKKEENKNDSSDA